MTRNIVFRLNGEGVAIEAREETVVVDWLRRDRRLTGTKEGCREGDCGACLVLLGGRTAEDASSIEWLAVPSCLLALGELDGRHLVTIEGLASAGPTPVMRALHGEGASQCGFCSPGIVVALTAFLLGPGPHDAASALAAVDGNLCRCTGYASIRRAAGALAADFSQLPQDFSSRLASLAARGVVPPALAATMADGVGSSGAGPEACDFTGVVASPLVLGGGTDYFVRNPDPAAELSPSFSDKDAALRRITLVDGDLVIGAAVTAREFFASAAVRAAAPAIASYERLVASGPIRARATLAGNIANASPVADMTAMLIALGVRLRLRAGPSARELPLERFFLGYKKLDLAANESIESIIVPTASKSRLFSFEKASKRANLDIASVNSAFACRMEDGVLLDVRLSAGGVGPTPLFLSDASRFLEGSVVDAARVREAARLAVAACAAQSDVRGSSTYRSTLMARFVYAHIIRLLPGSGLTEELFP